MRKYDAHQNAHWQYMQRQSAQGQYEPQQNAQRQNLQRKNIMCNVFKSDNTSSNGRNEDDNKNELVRVPNRPAEVPQEYAVDHIVHVTGKGARAKYAVRC